MGFLSGAKALFSAPKIIENGAKAIDALHYSPEEEDEDQQHKREMIAKVLDSATPSAISRRILVCVVSFVWLVCCVLWLVYGLAIDDAVKASITLKFMKEVVVWPFGAIVAFYFMARMKK